MNSRFVIFVVLLLYLGDWLLASTTQPFIYLGTAILLVLNLILVLFWFNSQPRNVTFPNVY